MAVDFTTTALIGAGILILFNQLWVSIYTVMFKERFESWLRGLKSHSKKVVTGFYLQGKQNANIYKDNTTTI